MSESEVLEELLNDFKEFQIIIKKQVKKSIDQNKKSGRAYPKGSELSFEYYSKKLNRWGCVILFDDFDNANWFSSAYCSVDNNKGGQDVYFVRNVKENPYFIHLTSHTISRVFERSEYLLKMEVNSRIFNIALLFQYHETILGIMYISTREMIIRKALDIPEELDEMTYLFANKSGYFIGKKTPLGNYIFKTFISEGLVWQHILQVKHSPIHKQGSNAFYLSIYYRHLNRHLYMPDEIEETVNRYLQPDEEVTLSKPYLILPY